MGDQILTFGAAGLYNATAAAKDHQTQSAWSGNDGVSIFGPLAGRALERIPLFQGSWQDFVRLHPEGDVLLYTNRLHRDGRHGHGSNQYPGKASVGPEFFNSLEDRRFDPRLKENEIVLGINDELGLTAVPHPDLRKEQGVVALELGGVPIVVFALPTTPAMGAYKRVVDGAALGFARKGDHFVDDRSGSRWEVDGRCTAGALAGRRLEPLGFATLEWLPFCSYHPTTTIYRSSRERVIEPVEDPCLRDVADRLARAGHDISRRWAVFEPWMPAPAISGLEIVVDGHPVRIFHFKTLADGEDWAPFKKESVARGCLAAGSYPHEIYQDDRQLVFLPDDQVRWSPLVASGELGRILEEAHRGCAREHSRPATVDRLLDRLKAGGIEARRDRYLLDSQLPIGAETGIRIRIAGERWLFFRFPSEADARREAERRGHCIQAGRFALWSEPPGMYVYHRLETLTRADDEVPWSSRLEDRAFGELIRSVLA